ncbi:MAG: hypothetical protein RIR00_2001 [Pseudomonadota bacterium]
MVSLKCSEQDPLKAALRGAYCGQCGQFDEAAFLENWHPSFFLVFNFIRRFNHRDFNKLGDPILSMIASEIWLFNISRLLQRDGPENITRRLSEENERRRLLPKCNTYSLAQFFDLPYQTVRRKVKILIDRGMVAKNAQGELSVTAACEASFTPEFNLETMREFISTARCVFSLLDIG